MTREEKRKALDDTVRDLFRNGGPMRAASAGKFIQTKRPPERSAVLERELQRLVRMWEKGE